MDEIKYQEQLLAKMDSVSEKLERMLTGGLQYPQGFEALTIALLGPSPDEKFPRGSIANSLDRIAAGISSVSTSIDELTFAVEMLTEEVKEIHGVTRTCNKLTGEIRRVRRT